MIYDAVKHKNNKSDCTKITLKTLFIQAIATSMDALSVGFTISNYSLLQALACVVIISIVTFFVCFVGVLLGKRFGSKLENKAEIMGGFILFVIGIMIFVKGIM